MVQTLPPRNGESSLPKPTPWQPKRYLEPTQPPPDERIKKEQYEAALAASELWGGGVDFAGRPPKLLKPRRTVDYLSGVGRYMTVSTGSGSTRMVYRVLDNVVAERLCTM